VFELGGDKEELEKFYQELKQIGETSPMSRVSWLFDRGLGGVPKDEKKAAEWIQRASEIRPEYLYWMGFRYERGKGVPRDEAEALRWYRKAAEQGVGPAQIILGNMYNHGRGVPKDETEAKKWFQKVEQADLDAMRRIAWWHAVSKVPELRDGMNAIVFAERLVALTSRTNANYLDTLACAYAETGQFEIAVNVQKEAISRLTNEDKSTYETQLKLFEARTPRRN
jgi:TPR repeat protein